MCTEEHLLFGNWDDSKRIRGASLTFVQEQCMPHFLMNIHRHKHSHTPRGIHTHINTQACQAQSCSSGLLGSLCSTVTHIDFHTSISCVFVHVFPCTYVHDPNYIFTCLCCCYCTSSVFSVYCNLQYYRGGGGVQVFLAIHDNILFSFIRISCWSVV